MKRYKKIFLIMIMSLLFSKSVFAAGDIDQSKTVSLTIKAICGENAVAGMEFRGYRISDIEENGELTVTDRFAAYRDALDIRGENDSAWSEMAAVLEQEILKDTSLKAEVISQTDDQGSLSMEDISMGLYLFVAEAVEQNEKIYTVAPFFVMLPSQDKQTNTWEYEIAVNAKIQSESVRTDFKVIKIWKDNCHENQRPKSIEIVLWCDGKEYDKVTLPENGQWQHTWSNLETGHKWTVTEKQQDGYAEPKIEREGYTFTVTNTCSKPKDNPSKLPQTGQLWWPVPVLICGGLLCIVIGLGRKRRAEHEK